MQFDKTYIQLLKEYTHHEGDQILRLLETKYRNRRIIFTKGEFVSRSWKQHALEPGDDHYPENYPKNYPYIHYKPVGTWYALGEEWAKWLSSDMPEWWNRYDRIYMIDLDYSNILRLNTIQKMRKFESEYSASGNFEGYGLVKGIDWSKVKQHYKGIEIIPYQWNMRADSRNQWYHSWDVGSGCVWSASAIKGVREIVPELSRND